jgi:hypothetical protein
MNCFLQFPIEKEKAALAISDLHPDALSAGWSRSFKLGEQRYEYLVSEHIPSLLNKTKEALRQNPRLAGKAVAA